MRESGCLPDADACCGGGCGGPTTRSSNRAATDAATAAAREVATAPAAQSPAGVPASVNGVAITLAEEMAGDGLPVQVLNRRACSELLRQAALAAGLLSQDDVASADGVQSEAASAAIERLLELNLHVPEPDDVAITRAFAANPAQFARGHAWHLAHILFAVTDQTPIQALANHAEGVLVRLRKLPAAQLPEAFASAAQEFSNCPSSQQGGDLGWLQQGELAPELARELLQYTQHGGPASDTPAPVFTGLVPKLLHSRFGFHIMQVLEHKPSVAVSLDAVRPAVAHFLQRQAYSTALSQYLQLLAGQATLQGVDLPTSSSPLVH